MRLIILLIFFPIVLSAQQSFDIKSYNNVEPIYLKLLSEDNTIRDNDKLNEQLIDLVKPYTTDSVYTRKRERHHVFGGAILPLLGIRWKTINFTKEKYVGTVSRVSITREEHFTEYDVNFDVVPHLKPYIDLSYNAYMEQYKMNRSKDTRKRVGEGNPPFVYPDENTDLKPYKIHCEVTPLREVRAELNEKFYPTKDPNSITSHINFGQKHPTLGLYGAYILDCNHSCHPEIHPYEWLWWIDLNPNKVREENERIWWVGFFRDASNRFKHWSPSPRVGEISIPFIFPADATEVDVNIDHQVFTRFDKEAFENLSLPDNASDFNFTQKVITIKGVNFERQITVNTNHPITAEGIAFYLTNINYDKTSGYLTGKLNLAMAVEDIYTTKVSFNYSR